MRMRTKHELTNGSWFPGTLEVLGFIAIAEAWKLFKELELKSVSSALFIGVDVKNVFVNKSKCDAYKVKKIKEVRATLSLLTLCLTIFVSLAHIYGISAAHSTSAELLGPLKEECCTTAP